MEMDSIELLKRQFLQVLDVDDLVLPSTDLMRLPNIQSQIYETMFRDGCLHYSPPDHYKIRVLKKLIRSMEAAITEPEEDEISDDLTECLAQLVSQPQVPTVVAAQLKHYVTFTMPLIAADAPTVTTHEARALLAYSGTTGLRTWEAALHLGRYLCSLEGTALVKEKSVFELGAGTGFVSMLCAMHLGAKHVLATDGSDEVIEDLSSNIFLNGLQGSNCIGFMQYKWGWAPPMSNELLDPNDCYKSFDLILGADVTYDYQFIMPLVSTLKDLLCRNPKAKALISAAVRNEETLQLFVRKCR